MTDAQASVFKSETTLSFVPSNSFHDKDIKKVMLVKIGYIVGVGAWFYDFMIFAVKSVLRGFLVVGGVNVCV